jgi:hypothetical protein
MQANGKDRMRKCAAHALPKSNSRVFCLLSGSCVFNACVCVWCINCQRCLAAAECGSHNLLATMCMEASNVCV